jgi:hypothetical protein
MDLDYSRACQFRWCWCDALFMSPPTFIALANYTGNSVYLEFADKEYLATTEYLFREFDDIPGGLYLRDSTFFDPTVDANGNLIFWSRGNGWVFGGLPAILRKLPATFAGRSRYVLCLRCAPGVSVHYTPGCVTCKVLVIKHIRTYDLAKLSVKKGKTHCSLCSNWIRNALLRSTS